MNLRKLKKTLKNWQLFEVSFYSGTEKIPSRYRIKNLDTGNSFELLVSDSDFQKWKLENKDNVFPYKDNVFYVIDFISWKIWKNPYRYFLYKKKWIVIF